MSQYFRFILGGALNTLISAVSFYIFDFFLLEVIALALSFWLTFFVSYIINSRFVFRGKNVKLRFLIAVLIAFFVQQTVGIATLYFGGKGMQVFIVVSLVHVPLFFLLCRLYVFREIKLEEEIN